MWDGDGHGFRHVWFKPTLSSLLKVFLSADRFSKLGKLAGFDTSLISWSQSERVYHRGRRRVSTVCVCVFFFNLASDVTRTRRRGILALLMKRRAIIKAASYWSLALLRGRPVSQTHRLTFYSSGSLRGPEAGKRNVRQDVAGAHSVWGGKIWLCL